MLISSVQRKIVWEGVNMETHCWFVNWLVDCQCLFVDLLPVLLVLEEFDVLRPLLWYKKHQLKKLKDTRYLKS